MVPDKKLKKFVVFYSYFKLSLTNQIWYWHQISNAGKIIL